MMWKEGMYFSLVSMSSSYRSLSITARESSEGEKRSGDDNWRLSFGEGERERERQKG